MEQCRNDYTPSNVQVILLQLLSKIFDDPSLDAFCQDYFYDVFNRFSRGMRKDEKITLLLDHCQRTPAGFDKLKDALNEQFPNNEAMLNQLEALRPDVSGEPSSTIAPAPDQPSSRNRLADILRDPIWGGIAALVTITALGWVIYTFFYSAGDDLPAPTYTTTTIAIVSTSFPTSTSTPTPTPTNTPVPPTDTPTFTPTPTPPPTDTPIPPTATSIPSPTNTSPPPVATPTKELIIQPDDTWDVVVAKAISLRQLGQSAKALAAFSKYNDMFSATDPTAARYSKTAQQFTLQLEKLALSGGVYIFEVTDESVAAEAGLAVGDIIIEINGQSTANMMDLTEALEASSGDTPLNITYLRLTEDDRFLRQTTTVHQTPLGVGLMPI